MDISFKHKFMKLWETYFPAAELPLGYYYTNDKEKIDSLKSPGRSHCLICELARVREGVSLAFDLESVRCGGGKRYLGFTRELRPDFEYFLSCGIPEKMEGERYKKTPEIVKEQLKHQPVFEAPAPFIVFKRWDKMTTVDEPLVIVFFVRPDALSGLFTLANYDEVQPNGVITPFGSGCSALVYYPYNEYLSEQPRAVLGMFDVSARPCVPANSLTFAVPWPKFVSMVDNMEESFLITASWNRVKERMYKE
jgi:uncharacterized protein (DUF169 family)